MGLLQGTCPGGFVLFPCSPWYTLFCCLEDAAVEFLHQIVDVSSICLVVAGQFIGSDAEEPPLGFLAVPSRVLWLFWCFNTTNGEDNWTGVTST